MKYGICREIRVEQAARGIGVSLLVEHETYGWLWSALPDREKAAILPRSIFCGTELRMKPEGLSVLQETAERLLRGRMVKVWQYGGSWYCGFPSWRNVRIQPGEDSPGGPSGEPETPVPPETPEESTKAVQE